MLDAAEHWLTITLAAAAIAGAITAAVWLIIVIARNAFPGRG